MPRADSQLPDFSIELAAYHGGARRVAGIDEAGRGPWAGPVVAAAVVLDRSCIPDGLNDSKKLSPSRRDELFMEIANSAATGIGIASVERIDANNILQATMAAMQDAVAGLASAPDFALIDGNRCPELGCQCEAVVKGDGRSVSIAAASIVAKVTRDRIMEKIAEQFPDYGFERHKGYGTAQHQAALRVNGPCPHHRRSFAPIRAAIEARR